MPESFVWVCRAKGREICFGRRDTAADRRQSGHRPRHLTTTAKAHYHYALPCQPSLF